ISLGNFALGADLRNTDAGNVSVPSVPDIDPTTQLGGASSSTSTFVQRISNSGGLSFPILKSPSKVFGLLLGKDVDLFRFETPVFNVNFAYTQQFPIFGPIVGTISGSLGASMRLVVGYDTHGLRELFNDVVVQHNS